MASSFRDQVLLNQQRILARLDALAPGAAEARDANGNGTWDEQSYWNSMLPAVAGTQLDVDASQADRLQRTGCALDACAASFKRDGVTNVQAFAVKCKRNGGNLLLTTSDGAYVENATVADLGQRYAQARAAGRAPRARCLGASVVAQGAAACDAWNEGVEACVV